MQEDFFLLHDILLSSVGTQKCSFHKFEKSESLTTLSTERELIFDSNKTLRTSFISVLKNYNVSFIFI